MTSCAEEARKASPYKWVDTKEEFYYLTHLSVTLGIKSQRMTPYQRRMLQEKFQVKPYLEKDVQSELARSLNISRKSITDWFYHMRQIKKQKEEQLCIGEYSVSKNRF